MSETKEPFTGPFSVERSVGNGWYVADANGNSVSHDYITAETPQWLARRLNAPAPDVRLSADEHEFLLALGVIIRMYGKPGYADRLLRITRRITEPKL